MSARRGSTDHRTRDASQILARTLITRALRRAGLHHILLGQPGIVGLVVPEADVDIYLGTATSLLKQRGFAFDRNFEVIHFDGAPPKRGFRTQEDAFKVALPSTERLVAIASRLSDIPDVFHLFAEAVVAVDPVDIRALRGVFRSVLGRIPPERDLEPALGASLRVLGAAVQRGRNPGWALRRLRAMTDAAAKPSPPKPKAGPSLSDLHGFGEAAVWGRSLAADLAEYRAGTITWAEVDRGVLVSGPPGVGKTIYAQALARECGVPIHIHSLARWQAKGYLNDVLKAMRQAFSEAIKDAPCLLFLDEIDSFGDRETVVDRNEHYIREVINGLLECLDGAESRQGVIVIGATNHPRKIDAAILRPGRLDRHIQIHLPDAPAREGILRHHLRGELADTDLEGIAARLEGASGAGIEQIVRDARRRARSQRRVLILDDLVANLPARVRLSDAAFRRACVHEAGHAVAGYVLRKVAATKPLDARVFREVRDGAGGRTAFEDDLGAERTRSLYLSRITILLAGLAAEQLVLGEHGDGGGGDEQSDLHFATMLAASLDLSCGLGRGLAYLSSRRDEALMAWLRGDPQLRRRVEADLDACLRRARDILTEHRHGVDEVAAALAFHGTVALDDFARFVGEGSAKADRDNCRTDVNPCATISERPSP